MTALFDAYPMLFPLLAATGAIFWVMVCVWLLARLAECFTAQYEDYDDERVFIIQERK